MCGRLNVTSDPLTQIVSAALGIKFTTETNTDLRPTQKVAAIGSTNSHLSQLDVSWGIKPQWAKPLANVSEGSQTTLGAYTRAWQ